MTLSEFITQHMVLAGHVEWDNKKNSLVSIPKDNFSIPSASGIYTMVRGIDVIKHGSSKNLQRRWMKEYLNPSYYNSPDRIKRDRQVRSYRKYFMGENRGLLAVYYLVSEIETIDPIFKEPTTATLKNFYENKLTALATESNHSLMLMKQKVS